MHAHAHTFETESDISEKFQFLLIEKYGLDEPVAREMSYEFVEMLQAVDADLSIFEKYFLL